MLRGLELRVRAPREAPGRRRLALSRRLGTRRISLTPTG
jgi:hypothetical protein